MLVLHGFWSPGDGLCLWAEDSDRTVKSPSQALRTARPHPFAATAGTLVDVHAGKAGSVVLRLPSLRSAPLDSPELVRVTPRPSAQSKPGLLPWTVPVVTLDASSALLALAERVDGVRHGASVDYLAEIAAFAAELVARGRVLPTLERDEVGPVAGWRPVLQGRDVVAVHALVTAMPPVCRAVPGYDDPHELVAAALRALVDAATRQALPTGRDLTPPRPGRRPKRLPVAEAWLAALSTPDGRFDADPGEVDALAETLAPWAEIGTGQTGPARATFRLTEIPDPDEPAWRLEFLLQSVEDPSLLVPADKAWDDDGSLNRWITRPQELLLAELGRATRSYPELVPGLRQARPCALDLDAEGAYHFCRSRRRYSMRPGSASCFPRGGTSAASSASPSPRTRRSTGWSGRTASSAAISWCSSGGNWLSVTTRSPMRRSPHSPRPRHHWYGCVGSG